MVLLGGKEVKPESGSLLSWEKGPGQSLTALESSLTSQPTGHPLGQMFSILREHHVLWRVCSHKAVGSAPGVADSVGAEGVGLSNWLPGGAAAAGPGIIL